MRLLELVTYFERIDQLSSRNAMIDVLKDLFRASSDPVEVQQIVYLSQGILLPAYRAVEIGVNEQLMARSIGEAVGEDIGGVKEIYRELGDYGLVAERVIQWEGEGISVTEAYEALLELAHLTGKGSTEAKVHGLAGLICRLSPMEARYLLRVPIGKLRLGVGEPTIMDGLSLAYEGDRGLRPVIENAYNLCGDIGLVARILCAEGPDRLRRFVIVVGEPIRVALAERTDSLTDIVTRLGECAVEPKYDGFRCQIHKRGSQVSIYTRNLENATDMFPDVVAATLHQISAQDAIFEGEAVSYDPHSGEFHPFQITVQRKRKHEVEAKGEELPLRLMAFDCLYCDGQQILYEPYARRRDALAQIVGPGEIIQITDMAIVQTAEQMEEYFERMVSAGLEGVMAKNLHSAYHAGKRTHDWIKFKRSYAGKLQDTVDCAIVGYFVGRGRRARWGIGSLLCAVYDPGSDRFETITKVSTGLSDQGWLDMKSALDGVRSDSKPARVESVYQADIWVEPTYVTEVLADEITRSPNHTAGREGGRTGYALRFPRIVTPIRSDRRPEDSTTVEEIKRLYDLQRGSKMPSER